LLGVTEECILTESTQKVTKALTEISKPGTNNKVTSVPYVSNLTFQTLVINALPRIVFCILSLPQAT